MNSMQRALLNGHVDNFESKNARETAFYNWLLIGHWNDIGDWNRTLQYDFRDLISIAYLWPTTCSIGHLWLGETSNHSTSNCKFSNLCFLSHFISFDMGYSPRIICKHPNKIKELFSSFLIPPPHTLEFPIHFNDLTPAQERNFSWFFSNFFCARVDAGPDLGACCM